MDWDRQKIKDCLEVLKTLPEFDNLPFPDDWASLYNIPITPAKIIDLKEYLKKNKESVNAHYVDYEIRPPAEGGVREVKGEEPPAVETIVKTVSDNDEQPLPDLVQDHQATESTDSMLQVNQDASSTEASLQLNA